MRFGFFLALLLAAGCAMAPSREPSLAPRPAETIDPRVPIPSEPVAGPADAALASRLDQLLSDIRMGSGAFDSLAAETERLAAAAGPAQSESWIVAQQLLSTLVAARAPVTIAMANIDALGSAQIQAGRLSAGDLAALEAASSEASAINQRQAELIDRLQAMLNR